MTKEIKIGDILICKLDYNYILTSTLCKNQKCKVVEVNTDEDYISINYYSNTENRTCKLGFNITKHKYSIYPYIWDFFNTLQDIRKEKLTKIAK